MQAPFTDVINLVVPQPWGLGIQHCHTFLTESTWAICLPVVLLSHGPQLAKAYPSGNQFFSHVGSLAATDGCQLHEMLTVGQIYGCRLSRIQFQYVLHKNGRPQWAQATVYGGHTVPLATLHLLR